MPREPAQLTIGAVAAATGVSADVLRSWELRHGFPTPERGDGGQRRYSAEHVAQIERVQADRRSGMSLESAIERSQRRSEHAEASIFAALRRRWPQQPVHPLSKRAVAAISRAIEDEACARAERPLLVGCFQRERYYRQSEQRWRELARTASWAVVFADFTTTRTPEGGATEMAVTADDPLLRDWVVICDSPRLAACIAAVELAPTRPNLRRRFETMWSTDPTLVRSASRIAAGLAGPVPGAADIIADRLPITDPESTQASAAAIVNRTIAYLDA